MKGDSKLKKPFEISYAFTREGISAFIDYVLADTFHAIETEDIVPGIEIIVGSRKLEIPMWAEQYEELSVYLKKAIETEEECNSVEN